ncbi:MAG: hypothetical protein Q4G40_00370, partial [Brachybacterium sp.]|nr:hypothetical protein [Brachybacterium sp.]
LARVHVQAWREAYGEILPPAFYDDAALESRTAMWQRFTARPPEDLQDRVRIARDADGAVKVDPDLDDLREIRMAR